MAIAYDNATHTPFFASTRTQSHTTSGSDRYLFIHLYIGTSATPTTITYGGVSLTLLATNLMTGGAAGQYIRTYGLVNPASGANNAVITFSGSPGAYASVVSYTGVDQATPTDGATNNGSSSTTSLTTSLTTTVDNCWLVGYAYHNGVVVAGTATTLRGASVNVLASMDSGGPKSPAGSHSLNTTRSPADFAGHVMVAIRPVSIGAPASTGFFAFF
jgi:hypothetical protein